MNPFLKLPSDEITGVQSCFDRVVFIGTLPEICHAKAMARYLSYHQIRLFDFSRWTESLREELRQNAEWLAAEVGLHIEFIRKLRAFLKEDRI